MRVAFIHPFLFRFPRGIERYTINLANALVRQNLSVDVLTWRWNYPVQIQTLDQHVNLHILPTSRYFAAQAIIPFYVWNLVRAKYDYVWIFFAGFGEAEAIALQPEQKFGIVLHYPYAEVPHRYREFQRYGLVKRAVNLVSVSQFVANGVQQAFARDSAVIHHGVDTTQFLPDVQERIRVRRELGIDGHTPLLVTVAALDERKGIQHIIDALPKVVTQFPKMLYLVLGEGSYRNVLTERVKILGLERTVRLLGAQADVLPYYQAADIALILSHGEASSLTTLEALACELPVIAANQPPFNELLPPKCGIILNEHDPALLAATICSLLFDPERRQSMGKAGRQHVQINFTWKHAASEYIRLMGTTTDLTAFA